MIQIIPMTDKTREQELLANHVEGSKVLVMEEKDQELGWVSININGENVMIMEFFLKTGINMDNLDMEQMFLLDTLMRSAASLGEINGATKITTLNSKYNNFFKKKGFEITELGACTPMSKIIHYTNPLN